MKKIKIYGRLRKFVGQAEFEADVNSPLEAISFLACNFKGIDKHMANQHYAINCGDLTVTEELLNMQTKSDIQIIPLAHGNFFFSIILGAGALFGSSAITTAGTLLGSKLLATVASTVLTSVGTSMLIGGVTEMLAPTAPSRNQTSGMDEFDPAALASNYSFTGLSNISRAGVPVNLVFGEIMVGSITISNGVDTVQVEGSNE
ncbi:Phage-related protein, tail component (COG4723) [uncultured Mediterranean phage uvMED]|nr:hypothetical protein PROVALCAL_00795 [uncultured phage MedDCM-OCT-S04-C26]ADD95633.1 hypothetical protein PROVALCAL_00795 [uncultured phage MedDCM-OCT-S11-C178]BAQ91986.1 Phage-related protein, tail component (COG4723) [uncultured Mediterranean phage uvMED]BAQ92050.1 Phage-related protein, tail component (COG4723) [uncultured Mediterranean phage uvMED]BAQ92116.1 Phage-related protein, tail component (COG4723) [uncultured Mediterranean phage uvMED]